MNICAIRRWGALLACIALAACPDGTTGGLTQGVAETGVSLPDGGSGDGGSNPDGRDAEVGGPETDGGNVEVSGGCVTASDCPAPDTACEIAICTNSVCGIAQQPEGASCDDGDPCTSADTCAAGVCTSGSNICGDCATDPNGTPCDDGSACTTGDSCLDGACAGGPAVVCPQGESCEVTACDPVKGCALINAPAGAPCSDGNPCSQGDTCTDGSCVSGTNTCQCQADADCKAFESGACGPSLGCQAGECVVVAEPPACPQPSDPCLAALCSEPGGCAAVAVADGTPCDSGIACAPGACQAGACVGANAPCDDGNQCTTDSCDGAGCVNTPVVAECDDGDPCTEGDLCSDSGECVPGLGVCGCETDEQCEGAAFDACLGKWSCVSGNCQADQPVDCSLIDGPCVVGTCSDGVCSAVPVADGGSCEQSNSCSDVGVCAVGICESGAPLDCDDNNPCTNDGCDPLTGCTHVFNDAPCDDNNACTTGDACVQGSCSAGAAVDCTTQEQCQVGVCDPLQGCLAESAPGGLACDDGDDCTEQDSCTQGVCGGAAVCDCAIDADCPDDGNACNGVPTCNADFKCEVDPATVVTCAQDDNSCTQASCEPSTGLCATTDAANGTPCSSGACSTGGSCDGGACLGQPVVCDDGNDCTDDFCDAATGLCSATPADGKACDDGDPCTVDDACNGGICTGPANSCDDADACTTDTCTAGVGCNSVSQCDDSNPCTDDSCDATGVGCINVAVVCTGSNPCEVGVCEPAQGGCVAQPAPNGTSCDDGDSCTADETCTDGTCGGGAVTVCDDGNACTSGSCVDGGCEFVPADGLSCDDGDPCTDGDVCEQGACVGASKTCDDDDPCTTDSCTGGNCLSVIIPGCGVDPDCENAQAGSPCDDGDPLTVADMCLQDTCAGYSTVINSGTVGQSNERYTRVHENEGKWYIGRQQFGANFPQQYAGVILNADNPASLSQVSGSSVSQDFFRDIHKGYALTYYGELFVRGFNGSWSNNGALSQAFANSNPNENMRQLWSFKGLLNTTVWASGGFAGGVTIRRCTAGIINSNCQGQGLPSVPASQWVPVAMRGHLTCNGLGFCSPNLVMAGDAEFQGSFFNSVFSNDGGDQNTWDTDYQDIFGGPTQVNDIAGDGAGNYLMVGTAGFMRWRDSSASVSNSWDDTVANQDEMSLNGVWAGAGAWIVVGTRDVAGGGREFLILAAAQGTDLSNSNNWTRYSLGFDAQFAAGILDVWGTDDGQVRGVGAVYGSSSATQPTQWVRQP